MDGLRSALTSADITSTAVIRAGANLYILTSNGYNTQGIEAALGDDHFLNAHATLLAEGSPHYWRRKLERVCGEIGMRISWRNRHVCYRVRHVVYANRHALLEQVVAPFARLNTVALRFNVIDAIPISQVCAKRHSTDRNEQRVHKSRFGIDANLSPTPIQPIAEADDADEYE